MKCQISIVIGLSILTTAAPVVNARDPPTEVLQQAGVLDKRDPTSHLDKRSWVDDALNISTEEDSLVTTVELMVARSIETEESLEKRDLADDLFAVLPLEGDLLAELSWGDPIEIEEPLEKRDWVDDVLKIITAKEPLVVPLITARSIETEEPLEKRDWVDDVLKIPDESELEPYIIPLVAAALN